LSPPITACPEATSCDPAPSIDSVPGPPAAATDRADSVLATVALVTLPPPTIRKEPEPATPTVTVPFTASVDPVLATVTAPALPLSKPIASAGSSGLLAVLSRTVPPEATLSTPLPPRPTTPPLLATSRIDERPLTCTVPLDPAAAPSCK